jgi:hypothetical protein
MVLPKNAISDQRCHDGHRAFEARLAWYLNDFCEQMHFDGVLTDWTVDEHHGARLIVL